MSIRDTIEDIKNQKRKEIDDKINEVKEITETISTIPSYTLNSGDVHSILNDAKNLVKINSNNDSLKLEGLICKSRYMVEITDKFSCDLAISLLHKKMEEYTREIQPTS